MGCFEGLFASSFYGWKQEWVGETWICINPFYSDVVCPFTSQHFFHFYMYPWLVSSLPATSYSFSSFFLCWRKCLIHIMAFSSSKIQPTTSPATIRSPETFFTNMPRKIFHSSNASLPQGTTTQNHDHPLLPQYYGTFPSVSKKRI